jgi:hypothetical protein
MEFSRQQRRLFFGLFLVLLTMLVLRFVSPHFLFAQISQALPGNTTAAVTSASSNAAQGQKVGNNLAIQFASAGNNFSESAYTMAILSEKSDETLIRNQINGSSGTVVIRFGVGAAPMSATEYGEMLVRIAGSIGDKKFVATANGNESNCNENRPLSDEVAFARTVGSIAGNNPKITLITGQIDYYCAPSVAQSRPNGGTPEQYRDALLGVPGIKGLAVPLYTGVAGDVNATVKKLDDFIKNVSVDVYITEAGPLKGSFKDFVLALQQASTRPNVKAILLFDSNGLNPDPGFLFTKPFWAPACREALRTILSETDKVVSICDNQLTAKGYFEFNIQRASTDTIAKNFLDEYSVSCLPKEDYFVKQENIEKCNTNYCPPGWQKWNDLTADLNITSDKKLFGLFRDEKAATTRQQSGTAPTNRLESLETYLDYRNNSGTRATTTLTNPSINDVSVYEAPLYKLTSLTDQCEQVKKKLAAVSNLCQQIHQIEGVDLSKEACALDTKVPNTQETQLQLWSQIQGRSCSDVMSGTSAADKQLQKKILDTPLALENAYRPAFIVAVTQFDGEALKNNNVFIDTDAHTPITDNNNFQVVDYLEVKVPVYGSDFANPEATRANPESNNAARNNYKDALRLTADILTSDEYQKDFQEKIDEDRQKMRQEFAAPTKLPLLIGGNGQTVFCYKDGQLAKCDKQSNTAADLESGNIKDAIPNALYTFINANATVNKDLPCEGTEDNFYSPDNVLKVAEEAVTIGSNLTPADKIGDFTKKKTAKVHLKVTIQDINKGSGINTHTQLYFVSPHHYNLEYAQQSFYNFLSLDQQNQQNLSQLGMLNKRTASVDQGSPVSLAKSKFPPSLRTDLNDAVTGNPDIRSGILLQGAAPPPTVPGQPLNQNYFNFSASVEALKDPNNQPIKHSLLWQVAGQVASLPTRLMALVTTPIGSAMSNYTIACGTDPNDPSKPNPHATEDWLLGKCSKKAKDDVAPKAQCEVGSNTTSVTNSGNRPTVVSDGVIAMALEASKYTCTPAEILVAVMAQETGGNNYRADKSSAVISGDPNEVICRNATCTQGGNDQSGPFSWYPGEFSNVYGKYGKPFNSDQCMGQIQINLNGTVKKLTSSSPLDPRIMGQAMCVTGDYFWAYAKLGDDNSQNGQPACSGAGQKAYTLADLPPSVVDHILYAFCAPGSDFSGTEAYTEWNQTCTNFVAIYKSLITGYTPQVEKVRGMLASCSNSVQ